MNPMQRNERGATLVEAIAFTVIAVLFVLAAVAVYQMVFQSSTAQTTMREIQSMQQDIQDLFANQASYEDLSPVNYPENLLIDAGIIPGSLHIAEGAGNFNKVRNNYGGQVDFQSAFGLGDGISSSQPSGNGASDQRFRILYTGLPKEACINIVTSLGGSFNQIMIFNADASVRRYSVDKYGNTLSEASGVPTGEPGEIPIEAERAQQACVQGGHIAYYSS